MQGISYYITYSYAVRNCIILCMDIDNLSGLEICDPMIVFLQEIVSSKNYTVMDI